ncbi:MAG: hypothetical protein QOC64_3253 [Solirubrobacteraceae bacterium]|nr:hypothetical protein [Solirubrobacteraceae bacterium]
MSRIDSLPADQRAVLQLLVRRDRRYDELSELLGVDEAVVRERAHEALAALGPAETAEPAPERRREIGDHLLGQQTGDERDATERLLAGSPSARAWAQAVSGELRELAGERLPDMPGDDDAAGAALEAAGNASAAEAFGEPRPERPRSSRRLGALLLGLIALAAVAVALVFVLGGDDDDDGGETTTPAASTTQATQAQPQVEAQVNLAPPSSRRGSKAVGVVLVQRAQAQRQIVAAVQGLPRPKSGGYGIWLYTNASRKQWLGFFASQDQEGRLLARGELEAPVEQFREILVTREARGNPSSPGPVFLRGRIQLAGGAGG